MDSKCLELLVAAWIAGPYLQPKAAHTGSQSPTQGPHNVCGLLVVFTIYQQEYNGNPPSQGIAHNNTTTIYNTVLYLISCSV